MPGGSTQPEELEFWRSRLEQGTLLSAIAMFPVQARHIFGALPVLRKDLLQLGMILAARLVLAESPDPMKSGLNVRDDERLRALIDALPDEKRAFAVDALSPEKQVEFVRSCARRIIREATGAAPS